MPRGKHRIISREVAGAAMRNIPLAFPQPLPAPPPKSAVERLYDLIALQSEKGYRFTDEILGFPWIRLEDIEDNGDGIFVIRFRCPIEKVHNAYFGSMAKDVCAELGCDLHFLHQRKEEFGIPYEECVWVLQSLV